MIVILKKCWAYNPFHCKKQTKKHFKYNITIKLNHCMPLEYTIKDRDRRVKITTATENTPSADISTFPRDHQHTRSQTHA